MTIVAGRVYAVGGIGQSTPQASVEFLDVTGGATSWQPLPDMPVACSEGGAAVANGAQAVRELAFLKTF